jgi:hypothetical protein
MELENKEKHTLDKKGNIRFDYLFSDWIFIWFVIYFLAGKTKNSPVAKFIYENMNPIIGLLVALFENIFLFALILIYNPNLELIFKFLLMMVIVKIIPIVLLYNNTNIRFIENSLSLIIIFTFYNLYLYIEDTNIHDIYKNTTVNVINNDNKTPFFRFYDYIVKIWKQ